MMTPDQPRGLSKADESYHWVRSPVMIGIQFKKIVKRMLDPWIFIQRLPAACVNAALLTFDDGPHSSLTPQLLDVLDAYHARACFFVVGEFAAAEPDLLREILARGHAIGNHTYSHSQRKPGGLSDAEDVYRCQQTIREITGEETRLFRPPMGRVTITGTLASRRLGAKQVLWSVEGGEWSYAKNQTAQEIAKRLAADIRSGDIVLLHDNNEKILTIVKTVLPALANRGLDLAPSVRHLIGFL